LSFPLPFSFPSIPFPLPFVALNPARGALEAPPAGPGGDQPPNAFVQYLVQICACIGRHFLGRGGHSGCEVSRLFKGNLTTNSFVWSVIR